MMKKLTAFLLVLSMMLPCNLIALAEKTSAVFYEEGFAIDGTYNAWSGCSWQESSTQAKNGNQSLQVTFASSSAWGGLNYQFKTPVTTVTDIDNTALAMWIKIPRSEQVDFTLQLMTKNNEGKSVYANLSLQKYITQKQRGKWIELQIPLSDIGKTGEYWNGSYNEASPIGWSNITGLAFKVDSTKVKTAYNIYIDDYRLIENPEQSKLSKKSGSENRELLTLVPGEYENEKTKTYLTLFDDYLDDGAINIWSGASKAETSNTEKKEGRASLALTFDKGGYHGAYYYPQKRFAVKKEDMNHFALHFWIKVPKEITLTLGVCEQLEQGTPKGEVSVFDYVYADQENEWVEINIPFSSLPPSGLVWNASLNQNESISFVWQNMTAMSFTINTSGLSGTYTFYIDDIRIVENTVSKNNAQIIGVEEQNFDAETAGQNFTKLDLKPYMNMAYRDEISYDGQGGWIDQGDDDMRYFDLQGEQTFLNVPFDVIQPEENNGKSVIVLRGQNRMYLPTEVSIPVNQKAAGAYFLHSAAWVENNVGEYIFYYADGTRERLKVRNNYEINDWGENFTSEMARTVCQIANDNGKMGGFGVCAWANPKPDVEIKSITAKTTGSGAFLMLEAITLTDKGPYMMKNKSVPEANPDTSDWYAYEDPDFEKMAGSPIDMSHLLDAPAGKHGRLTAKGDDFYFEDGTKAKFIGTNIVAEANFQSKEEIDHMVDWLAMCGYNLARLHHLDADFSKPNIFGNGNSTRSLDPVQLDKVDYLCAKLKERGIYLYVDGTVYRSFQKGELPAEVGSVTGGAKIMGMLDRSVIDLQKEYLKQLFTHINPYTGMSLAEDPALVMVDIINENSLLWRPGLGWAINGTYRSNLLQGKLNAWLLKKYSSTEELEKAWTEEGKVALMDGECLEDGTIRIPNDFYSDFKYQFSVERKKDLCEFLFDTEVDYFKEMLDYMKNELGIKCMITGSNVPETEDTLDILANLSFDSDYLDRHRYYSHPSTMNYLQEGMPLDKAVESMLKYTDDHNMIHYFGRRDVYGAPYVLSEWNNCEPNQYYATEMITMNAYSAMHNWVPINFAFLQGKQTNVTKLGFVFNTNNSPVKLAMQAVSAPMLLRGDVSEAEYGYYDIVTKEEALDPTFTQSVPDGLPFIAKSGMMWEELARTNPDTTKSYEEIKDMAENANGVFVSVTGELKTDSVNQLFEVNTEKSQGFSGMVGTRELVFDDMDFCGDMHYASVILTSLEDVAISESNHLLLVATARNRNTAQEFRDDAEVVKKAGSAPLLIEPVVGNLFLKTGHDYEVYALDSSGQRKKQMTTERMTDGRLKITLASDDKTMYYEFVKTTDAVTTPVITKPEWSQKMTFTPKSAYSDITGHWAESQIASEKYKGTFKEMESAEFYPDEAITRGEFVAWLIRVLGVEKDGENFCDVTAESPYFREIVTAKKLGIAVGEPDGTFRPEATMTREEMSVFFERVLLYSGKLDTKLSDLAVLQSYSDWNEISTYAQQTIAKLSGQSLLVGNGNAFCPKASLTRAEAVVIVRKIRGCLA